MKKSRLLGLLYACAFTVVFNSSIASAATINVTNVFRFIRTDVYAESGGVIDQVPRPLMVLVLQQRLRARSSLFGKPRPP